MARKSILDSDGYDAFKDAEDNFIELYAAIGATSTGTPWTNAIFVGKSGDDSNDGTLIGTPKLTFASAISAAGSGDVIVCLDMGEYTEDITCKAGVDIYAPNAKLNGHISLSREETVVFREVAASSGQAIQKPAGTTDGVCRVMIGKLILTGTANGVACFDTGSTIHLVASEISVNTGTAIGSTVAAIGVQTVRVGRVIFSGAGTAVGCYGASGLVSGLIGVILESGSVSGTTGLNCVSGEISLFIGKNDADTKTTGSGTVTGFEPGSGTTADVTGGSISGVEITGSSINGSEVGTSVPADGCFTSLKDTGLASNSPVFTDSDKKLTNDGTLTIGQGGTGEITALAAFNAIKQAATDAYAGVIERATVAEAEDGTDNERAVTPAGLKAAIDNIDTDVIPVGSVFAFATEDVPTGFLECDGSAISRSSYSALYSAIGVRHGAGDGSTTFNLPDYRGQFLRGWDHGAGVDPDAASRSDSGDGTTGDHVGTNQSDQLASHRHSVHARGVGTTTGFDAGTQYGNYDQDLNTSYSGGNETRPININVMWCIKY